MKEILYILLDNYADHEMAILSEAIRADEQGLRATPHYVNRVVAPTLDPVRSVGGFRLLPDYSFETMPPIANGSVAALVLIGGYSWDAPVADALVPIEQQAIQQGVIVGAICNAAAWMAKQGLLNQVRHTGNGLYQLQQWGGDRYTHAAGYVEAQAVADGGIVTANGTGYLEFACELLKLLRHDTDESIDRLYQFYKLGLTQLMAPQPRFKCNTIGLFTRDNRAIVDFYTRAFGFRTDWDGMQPNVEMWLGDQRIILFPRNDFEAMTSQTYSYPAGFNGTMEVAIDVPTFADVDPAYQQALACGGRSVMPPTTEPWGQRTCYVADPDGNLVEIGSFGAIDR